MIMVTIAFMCVSVVFFVFLHLFRKNMTLGKKVLVSVVLLFLLNYCSLAGSIMLPIKCQTEQGSVMITAIAVLLLPSSQIKGKAVGSEFRGVDDGVSTPNFES